MSNLIPFRRTDTDAPIVPATPERHLIVRHKVTRELVAFPNKGETIESAIARLSPAFGLPSELEAVPFLQAFEDYESKFRTEPTQISEKEWHNALGILPPSKWRSDATSESFMSCEHTAGRITAIYVRAQKRFFTFQDSYTMSHEDIMRRVYRSVAYRNVTL